MSLLFASCSKPTDMDPVITPSEPPAVVTPATPVIFTATLTNTAIYNGTNEIISIVVSSGVEPYTYKIGTADFATMEFPKFVNLSAGTYTITVKDSKGTVASQDVVVPPFVAVITPLAIYLQKQVNVDIYNLKTGSLEVRVNTGTYPYAYTSTDAVGVITAGTLIVGSGCTFNNLHAGTYLVTVTDSKQQTATLSVVITQPAVQTMYTSTTPASILSTYSGLFRGRNRFSVSFTYETAGNHINRDLNNGSAGSLKAALLTVVTDEGGVSPGGHNFNDAGNGCIKLELSTSGISYKRYQVGATGVPSVTNVTEVVYANSTVWNGKHKVVISYDGSIMSLYVDGALISSASSGVEVASYGVYVGNDGDSYMNYNGTITNFKIYNEALIATDIAAL